MLCGMFLAWTFWKQQSYLATSKTGGNFLKIFLARLADTLSVQIKDWKGTHGSLIWAWLCSGLGRDQNSLSAIPGHQLGPAECSPCTVSFIMQEFLFTWKGIIVSSLPESVSCVCTATGVFTSLYLRSLCDAEASNTSPSLAPFYSPGVTVPVPAQLILGHKTRSQCKCQGLFIITENQKSMLSSEQNWQGKQRLLGESYQ